MTRRASLALALLLAAASAARAQAPRAATPVAAARPQARAVQLSGAVPHVDGSLDDAVWQTAEPITSFVQKVPDEGRPATERTELRFLYDERALYVGARMVSSDPAGIQAPVSRRDNGAQAERILVSFDTYHDRRTAYTFGVTASGVRLDWYHAGDKETETSTSFDPVWTARVQRDSTGWTAEMRIPFSQLRFSRADLQTWGVNVVRSIPTRKEDDYWVMVPSRETGWASRFGELVGIAGIRPTRRVELTPYVSSGAAFTSSPGVGNPFDDGREESVRMGADLKMGLGPNLTLDATVNPDFGQVELDPAEVNLTAFETFFTERRPFFTEGSQLLAAGEHFYSRRIGAPASEGLVLTLADRASGDYTYLDAPRSSTILGAAKLTGRLPSRTSVGILAALTRREDARIFGDSVVTRFPVAPSGAYAVARVQQEIGGSGSTAGLALTGVRRDLEAGSPLAAFLNRQAYTGVADGTLRLKDGEYEISGSAGFSWVQGDSLAILRTQRSSARYFQRPDATHTELDPSRTSLSGFNATLSAERAAGKHWLWDAFFRARTPGFELNDVGAMGSADRLDANGNLFYRETRPGTLFRAYQLRLGMENRWNFGGDRTWGSVSSAADFVLKNFWRGSLSGWVDLRSQNETATRGGPLMGRGQAWGTVAQLSNPSSARTRVTGVGELGGSELGEVYRALSGSVSIRPGPRWQLSLDPGWSRWTDPRQYVATRPNGTDATFGQRYVFAFIDRHELRARMRLNYLFTPDLSLELVAEPYAASGHYHDYGELLAARSSGLRFYGVDGGPAIARTETGFQVTDGDATFALPFSDFNVRSFRSNAVMRWEWRPGSTLYVVWQQDREGFTSDGRPAGLGALPDALRTPGDNFLAIKMNFWIPIR